MSQLDNFKPTQGSTRGPDRRTQQGGASSPGMNVFTSQRVMPPSRQRSGLPDFLANLGQWVDGKRRQMVDDQTDEIMATGNPEEAMEDAPVDLRNSIAFRLGRRRAVERLARLENEFDQRVAAGEDPEEVARSYFEDALEAPESENEWYRRSITQGANAALDWATQRGTVVEAAEADRQTLDDFYTTAATTLDTMSGVSVDTFRQFASDENEWDLGFGLTKPEIARNSIAATKAAMSNTSDPAKVQQLHDSLTEFLKGYDKGELYRNQEDLAKTRDAALTRIRTAESEAALLPERERNDLFLSLLDRINTDATDPSIEAALAESREGLGESYYVQLKRRHQDRLTVQADAKRTLNEFERSIMAAPPEQFGQIYHGLGTTQQRVARERLEARFRQPASQLINAARQLASAEDDQQRASILNAVYDSGGVLDQMHPMILRAREAGYTPTVLKQVLEVPDPKSPNAPAASQLYSLLAGKYGEHSPIFDDISDDALVNLRAFDTMYRIGGLSAEEAQARIDQYSDLSERDLVAQFDNRGDYQKMLDKAIESIEDTKPGWGDYDIRNSPTIQQRIRELALADFRYTQDAEKAVEWATERVMQTHSVMNGQVIPSEGINRLVRDLYNEESTQNLLKTRLAEEGIEVDTANVVPFPTYATATTGEFHLFDRENNRLLQVDGAPVIINSNRLARRLARDIGVQYEEKWNDEAVRQARNAARESAMDDRSWWQRLSDHADDVPASVYLGGF